jgi:PAS domain S-box-containing protein
MEAASRMGAQPQDSWLLDAQPKIGLLRGFASVSMRLVLLVMLPLSVVFLFAFILEYRAEVRAERARLVAQEVAVIQRGIRWVERELEIATSDLQFIADLVAEGVGDGSLDQLTALEQSALAFVRSRPGYFQIRFIDATGHEVIHIENPASGPRITPKSELQNKSERGYFTDTMRLEPGGVFVSRMDLNVERGVVEEPYKPVVRLATPIDDAAGQRRGIVVLNAHGGHFLRAFEPNTDEAGIQRMIVDSEGYWLQHRPEVEWGFALEHGRSFQRTFPEVWEQLLMRPQDGVEAGEGLFYFDAVALRPAASSDAAQAREPQAWMFISLVPRRLLDDIAVQVATPLLVIAMPLYFALLVVGWALAAAIQRRRLADEALRSLEAVRSAMMRAALEGIVVMDEAGITLEFNPSARRIFGYTREEVRGKLVADLIIPPAHRETHRKGLEHYLATGEGRIIDKHIDELTAIRKGGEEFPVELTVCPVMVAGKQLFCGFLRDLSERGRSETAAEPPDDSSQT